MNAKLELRDAEPRGKGVFAGASLARGERLVVFGGRIMTLAEERCLPEPIRDFAHQIDDDLVIGIDRPEDIQPVDYLNHSCDPNAGFAGQIVLVAMRDVRADEEITFDYAMTLSEAPGAPYRMKCACGAAQCRWIVTDADWRIPELQARYRGYFQPHLEEKICRSAPAPERRGGPNLRSQSGR
jgi:hypothetical protein